MEKLPVTEILEDLGKALALHPNAVLRAPPGAGKTTGVPLYLLKAAWMQDAKTLMLAPRRLAARAAAHRMASVLGEKVGQTVGYRVRMDTRIGPKTRVEVVTEGVLTRMLQSDPSLSGVGLVIFDEFHERSLDADLGLALCLDIQGVLNTDLKLLVMSATMEAGPIAELLGNAPLIDAQGRTFPIETRYMGRHTPTGDMAEVAGAVLGAIQEEKGSILVFLPGAAEIHKVARQLDHAGLDRQIEVVPLLGNLSSADQDRAIAPSPRGRRKIVLATAIAETSLTIEGISVVVDSGLQRIPKFDVRSGMSRLVTLPVSKASADQRRGRAGRLGPGVCLRLWSESMNSALPVDRPPEVLETDLCYLALNLASWGVRHPNDLKWLDPPPGVAYAGACDLLRSLNALDHHHQITRHGREMATMAAHPRLAHMLLMARKSNQTQIACDLAALITERDPLRFQRGQGEVDLQVRYDLLQACRRGKSFAIPSAKINRNGCRHILNVSDQLRRQLGPVNGDREAPSRSLGRLLAWAYPDRIARRRRADRLRYVMTGGQGIRLDSNDPMAGEEFIVAVETDGKRMDGRIFRAAAYDVFTLEEQFAHQLEWREQIHWDDRRQAVVARRVLLMGALSLRNEPLTQPDPTRVISAMLDGIRQNSLRMLPWNKSLRSLQARICFLHRMVPDENGWPDLSDDALLQGMGQWLPPYLSGATRLKDLARIDLKGALLSRLSYDQHRLLDTLAPTHWTVPSGSRIPIDYSGNVPVLAVRLQEMFGLGSTPSIAGGRQPLLIHLLSPAGRPVQITQDLAGFWRNSYHEVKKELKGRYPKHHWPDDPLLAQATARAKTRKK